MQSMQISAGTRGAARITRESVPQCHCVKRHQPWGTPERDCACCEGTGQFAECEQCCQERVEGEMYRIDAGTHSYLACSPACVGTLVTDALDSEAAS